MNAFSTIRWVATISIPWSERRTTNFAQLTESASFQQKWLLELFCVGSIRNGINFFVVCAAQTDCKSCVSVSGAKVSKMGYIHSFSSSTLKSKDLFVIVLLLPKQCITGLSSLSLRQSAPAEQSMPPSGCAMGHLRK